jgi:hypothetical protein
MNFTQYKNCIAEITLGKSLPSAIYLHETALEEALPQALIEFICNQIESISVTTQWNLLKLYKRDFKIALLHYPEFDTYAYPALHQSITIDLEEKSQRTSDYSKSENPPILHKKPPDV